MTPQASQLKKQILMAHHGAGGSEGSNGSAEHYEEENEPEEEADPYSTM